MTHRVRRIMLVVALLAVVPALVGAQYEDRTRSSGSWSTGEPTASAGWCESWGLCAEDVDWLTPHVPSYQEYYDTYVGLKNTFDPATSIPTPGPAWRARPGMRYVVFTTKHHDGFCMFDTRQTDYKHHRPPAAPSTTTRRPTSPRRLRRVPPRGLRHRRLLLEARLARRPGYWSPDWPHARPQRELRHGGASRELADVRATSRTRRVEELMHAATARSTSSGSTAAWVQPPTRPGHPTWTGSPRWRAGTSPG